MANPEACEVWIDQRIEEEQGKGTSHPDIGRIIGEEIFKVFESKIEARTIEQRSRRIVATNVAPHITPEHDMGNQENQSPRPHRATGEQFYFINFHHRFAPSLRIIFYSRTF